MNTSRPDLEFLRQIHSGNIKTPTVYFHGNWLIRNFFWYRFEILSRLINRNCKGFRRCLDFGGGSGVFLPTLSKVFDEVVLLDLDPSQARLIIEKFALKNCRVVEENIFNSNITSLGCFDCIVAADVLEHFSDTAEIATKLRSLMSPDTLLMTSLPSETWVYDLLRMIFNEKKPEDHYYSAKNIQMKMKSLGFDSVAEARLPSLLLLDLFRFNAWKISR